MTNRFFTAVLLLTGLFFMSCGSDDDGDAQPDVSGTVTFDGTSFQITKGYVTDFGNDGTHYNFDFEITDGSVTSSPTNFSASGSFYGYIELFSPGTNNFSTGTFSYLEFSETPEDNEFYFNSASVLLDSDENGILDLTDDGYQVTDGTVIVTGEPNNYTLQYDLTFTGGRALEGTVSGNFITQ